MNVQPSKQIQYIRFLALMFCQTQEKDLITENFNVF